MGLENSQPLPYFGSSYSDHGAEWGRAGAPPPTHASRGLTGSTCVYVCIQLPVPCCTEHGRGAFPRRKGLPLPPLCSHLLFK